MRQLKQQKQYNKQQKQINDTKVRMQKEVSDMLTRMKLRLPSLDNHHDRATTSSPTEISLPHLSATPSLHHHRTITVQLHGVF